LTQARIVSREQRAVIIVQALGRVADIYTVILVLIDDLADRVVLFITEQLRISRYFLGYRA
jgi:hypothetical protein